MFISLSSQADFPAQEPKWMLNFQSGRQISGISLKTDVSEDSEKLHFQFQAKCIPVGLNIWNVQIKFVKSVCHWTIVVSGWRYAIPGGDVTVMVECLRFTIVFYYKHRTRADILASCETVCGNSLFYLVWGCFCLKVQ